MSTHSHSSQGSSQSLSWDKRRTIREEIRRQTRNQRFLAIEETYWNSVLPSAYHQIQLDVLATTVELEMGEFDAATIASRYIDLIRNEYAYLLAIAGGEGISLPNVPSQEQIKPATENASVSDQ